MPITVPDSHKDLLTAPIASLTTIGTSGGPQASLVWFAYDEADQKFKVSLSTDRVKTKNLIMRPQVSLLILDPNSPMRYLDVRGSASIVGDEDYAWVSAHIGPKYDANVRDFDTPETVRVVAVIEPASIYAFDQRG